MSNNHDQRLRILIADADEQYCTVLRNRLRTEPDLEVVGTATDGERAARLTGQLQPDVALLDVDLPRIDGIAAAEKIASLAPDCRPILLARTPSADYMRRAMLVGAREFLIKPVDGEELIHAIHRVREVDAKRRSMLPSADQGDGGAPATPRQGIASVFTVWGPKGGVGKTFLATNLALALAANKGKRVVLLDGALEFGTIDVFLNLNLELKKTIIDLLVDHEEDLDPDLVGQVAVRHSLGLDAILAPPPESMAVVTAAQIERLLRVLCRLYDYVVVDTPPTLDETTLAFLDLSDNIMVVSTPELPALRVMRLLLNTTRKLGYSQDKVRFVLNRADMRGAIQIAEIEKACQWPISVILPNEHEAVAASINSGKPIVLHQPQRAVSKEIIRLAANLAQTRMEEPAGTGRTRALAVPRLFRRAATPSQ